MQIIWDSAAAQQLRSNHTVLELETFVVNDQSITAYCVVPSDKVFPDITRLESIVELHTAFIKAFNEQDYQLCQDIAPSLIGSFNGDLDSFYATILDKISNAEHNN